MYDMNATSAKMYELFCSIYPDRPTDFWDVALSSFPKEALNPKKPEYWIMKMKMKMKNVSILAENQLSPTDLQAIQDTLTEIFDMLTPLNKPLSYEELSMDDSFD